MSLLAVLTIAVSLFTGGVFLLVTGNLSRVVREWRSEARVLVYLERGTSEEAVERLRQRILESSFVTDAEAVAPEEASRRFATVFPGLAHLLSDWEEPPLPPSVEVGYDAGAVEERTLGGWLDGLRRLPGVEMVDEDRLWLRQLETLVVFIRGVGVLLMGLLLAASVFTIASVVRLTAYLHREEIGIMRLVGATEFVIHGPFWTSGVLQGLAGGLLALLALLAAHRLLGGQALPPLLGSTLFARFLGIGQLAALLVVGAVAGLLGAALASRQR